MTTLTNGIVAYWKFDENTGTSAGDITGNGNVGTWHGTLAGAQWTTGIINSGGSFDNTRYVSVPTITVSGDFSLSCWVNLTSNSVTQFLNACVAKGLWGGDAAGDFSLGYQVSITTPPQSGTGKFCFTAKGAGAATSGAIDSVAATAGSWVHLVGTISGTLMTLYKNGVSAGTGTLGAGFVNNSHTLDLGAYPGQETQGTATKGSLDEIGLWSRALLQSEVTQLYNSGIGLQYPFQPPSPNPAYILGLEMVDLGLSILSGVSPGLYKGLVQDQLNLITQ